MIIIRGLQILYKYLTNRFHENIVPCLLSDLEQNRKKTNDRCCIEREMNETQMDSCTMNGIALQHILNVYVNKMNFRKYE